MIVPMSRYLSWDLFIMIIIFLTFDCQENIKAKLLTVSHAFHSPMMQPMLDKFSKVVEQVKLKAPRIRFISSKTGKTQACSQNTECLPPQRHGRRR